MTAGANLAAADLPGHTHTAIDIVSGELPHKVQHNGADVGTRRAINLVEGTRVTLDAADDPTNDRVSLVVNAAPPVAGEITNALGYVPADLAGDHFTGPVDCGPHQAIGGPLENMAKHSENYAAAAWDKRRRLGAAADGLRGPAPMPRAPARSLRTPLSRRMATRPRM